MGNVYEYKHRMIRLHSELEQKIFKGTLLSLNFRLYYFYCNQDSSNIYG